MATTSPVAVVISASEIPPASVSGLPTPSVVITAKTLIIPITVPKRPSKGAMAAMVPSVLRFFSSDNVTWRPTSSILSLVISRGASLLIRPEARIWPNGEFSCNARIRL